MNPDCRTRAGQSLARANQSGNKANPASGECIQSPNTGTCKGGKPAKPRNKATSWRTKGSSFTRSSTRQSPATAQDGSPAGTRQAAKVKGQRVLRNIVAAVYTDSKGVPQRSLATRAANTKGGATNASTPSCTKRVKAS